LNKSGVTHKCLETIRGPFLQGRTLNVMPCSLLDMYQHGGSDAVSRFRGN
jgi:hypothetical protein